MRFTKLRLIPLLSLLVSACAGSWFPGVHRITIQQGNVITQAMVDQLRPGMTRSQVRFVLGTAVLDDSLDRDRWDYVYTLRMPDGEEYRALMSLYFADDRLARFEGNYKPSDIAAPGQPVPAGAEATASDPSGTDDT
jgi:outer membrane protein assembly factor BamE